MIVETREQYRNLMDALSVGDHLGEETHASLVAFAKAKKMKQPPADNPAPEPKPSRKASTRVTNKGATCKTKGCDKSAQSLGLCKACHTKEWRNRPENKGKAAAAARKHNAKKRLVALAQAIGPGFHPDTPGADYDSLPEGITPERVDEVVKGALAHELDVYAITLDAVNA